MKMEMELKEFIQVLFSYYTVQVTLCYSMLLPTLPRLLLLLIYFDAMLLE